MTKCGRCGHSGVVEVRIHCEGQPPARAAHCTNPACMAEGAYRMPHEWTGLVNEAANLRYTTEGWERQRPRIRRVAASW